MCDCGGRFVAGCKKHPAPNNNAIKLQQQHHKKTEVVHAGYEGQHDSMVSLHEESDKSSSSSSSSSRKSESGKSRQRDRSLRHGSERKLGAAPVAAATSSSRGSQRAGPKDRLGGALTSVARRVQYNFNLPSSDTTFFTQLGAAGVNVAAVTSVLLPWFILRRNNGKCGSEIDINGDNRISERKRCDDDDCGGDDDGGFGRSETYYSLVVGPAGADSPTQNAILEALLKTRGICFETSDVAQVLSVAGTPGAYAVFNKALVNAGVIALQSYFGESPTANVSIMYTVRRRDLTAALAALAAV